jgi:hypothetical protein
MQEAYPGPPTFHLASARDIQAPVRQRGVYAFARYMEGEASAIPRRTEEGPVIAILNAGDSPARLRLPVDSFDPHPPASRDLLIGWEHIAQAGTLHLEAPSRQGLLLA